MKMRHIFILLTFVITVIMTIYSGDYTKCFAWLLLIFCFNKAPRNSWFSPYYLFMVTIISYILYWDELGGIYMDTLSLYTRFFALSGMAAVVFGFMFGQKFGYKPIKVGNLAENFYLVFLIGLLPTALSYMIYGNIASLDGEEMLEAKEQFTLPVIGQLAYFLPASIVVACKKNDTKKILIALGFSFLAALLTISKTAMLLSLIYFLIAITKFHPSIRNTRIFRFVDRLKYLVIPVIVIYMFMYNNNKRNDVGRGGDMAFVESSSSTLWGTDNLAQNMFLNYCYFVQPWSNLNYNIENNHKVGSFGGNTLAQFGKKVGIKTNARKKIQPSFFNTHTFLTDYYLDFGAILAILVSFLLGILIYTCYVKFGLSDDPLLISFYILIAYATVMMFFSNHFNNGYLLNYFITFGLVYWFTRKSAKR